MKAKLLEIFRYYQIAKDDQEAKFREFPGSPGVRTPRSHYQRPGFNLMMELRLYETQGVDKNSFFFLIPIKMTLFINMELKCP